MDVPFSIREQFFQQVSVGVIWKHNHRIKSFIGIVIVSSEWSPVFRIISEAVCEDIINSIVFFLVKIDMNHEMNCPFSNKIGFVTEN